MKMTIDCDWDKPKLNWVLPVLSGDLLPWEEKEPERMQAART
jgi:hypothetical protein